MFKYKQLINRSIDTDNYLIGIEDDFCQEQVSNGYPIDFGYNQLASIVNIVGVGSVFRIVNLKLDGTFNNCALSYDLEEDFVDFRLIKYDTDKIMIIGSTLTTTKLFNISYNRTTNTITEISELDLSIIASDFEIEQISDTRFVCLYTNDTTTSIFSFDIDEEGVITKNTTLESVADTSTHLSMSKIDSTHVAVAFAPDTTAKVVLKVMTITSSTGNTSQQTTKTIGTNSTNNGEVLLISDGLLGLFYAEAVTSETTATMTVQTYTINPATYVLTAKDSVSIDDYEDIEFANITDQDLVRISDNRFVLTYTIDSQGSATFVLNTTDSTDVLTKVESFTYTTYYEKLHGFIYNDTNLLVGRLDNELNNTIQNYEINAGTETITISLKNERYSAINTGIFLKLSADTSLSSDEFTVTTYATLNEDTYPNDIDWFVLDTSTLDASSTDTGIINTTVPIEGIKIVFDYSEESTERTYNIAGSLLTNYGA